MFDKLVNKMLDDDENLIEDVKEGIKGEVEEETKKIEEEIVKIRTYSLKQIIPPLFLFLLAFGVRLAFMIANNPQSPGYGWYGDVYHHWQIAYLTKEVGFSHGFLRLWDLKGMEYFWGLAHPLTLIIVSTLAGSISIVIPRLLSIICGSTIVVYLYLLIRRYTSALTAFLVGLWAALFSVVLFSDTLGMQEQLGLFFLLTGILAWPRYGGFISGLFWFFAAMTRSEFWLFSTGLVFVSLFDRTPKISERKMVMFFTYGILIFLYMKYLANSTGNYIFPVYWNFLASFVGEWFTNTDQPLNSVQITGQWFGRGLFGIGVLGTLISFWKRPKFYLFLLLGFFNLTFIGFMFGFGAYIHGFFERFYVDRLLAFPYLFLGILVIWFFLEWLPGKVKRLKGPFMVFGVIVTIALITSSQIAWIPIMKYFKIAQAPYNTEITIASYIAKNDPGGNIVFPAGRPALTYSLVHDHGVSGKRFISDMYDPYYYPKDSETKEEIDQRVIDWMERENVKLLVNSGKLEYATLVADRADRFKLIGSFENVILYEFLR